MPAKSETYLSLHEICQSYSGRQVLDHVSLTLKAGALTCLLGPSGCGKSTTLRIAAGVETQSHGRVILWNNRVSAAGCHIPPEARSCGLMFQDFALFPHLTVAQNIAFGLSGSRAEKAGRVDEMLARVGLLGFGESYPHQLSGGEQQRVALARAIAPRPKIVLMDEPFSGLDNRLRDEVRDATLALLKEEGSAVLLVTHEPDEAMRMADQIALMRAGRIVQIGSPYNVYNAPKDASVMRFFSDVNVIRGTVRSAQTDTPFGRFLTPGIADGQEVEILIRPQHLKIDFDRQGRGPNPTIADGVAARAAVRRARFLGQYSLVEFVMEADGSLLQASVPGVFLPPAGLPLWLSVRRDRCFVFPIAKA